MDSSLLGNKGWIAAKKKNIIRNLSCQMHWSDNGLSIIVFDLIKLFDRGKGDYFRLGHNNDTHVRKPQVVEALRGKKIVDVAVGALHCLAVSDQGQVRNTLIYYQ